MAIGILVKVIPKTHKGLTEFFGHSDCDGEISPEMCKIVADELEAILPYVEELAKKKCLMVIYYVIVDT
ncbi:hypothetical protein [Bacillus sonorensis]|nr:hypothetical protein [Bacillus sonorensis]